MCKTAGSVSVVMPPVSKHYRCLRCVNETFIVLIVLPGISIHFHFLDAQKSQRFLVCSIVHATRHFVAHSVTHHSLFKRKFGVLRMFVALLLLFGYHEARCEGRSTATQSKARSPIRKGTKHPSAGRRRMGFCPGRLCCGWVSAL